MKVSIIGKGKMGLDIFNYLLDYEINLNLICRKEMDKEELNKNLTKKFNRMLKNSIINNEQYNYKINNIIISTDLSTIINSDIIIESIIEDINQKKDLFNKIKKYINNETILTTNSSSIIPSKIFDNDIISNSIGLHFFYPVKLKNIVEIIKTDKTKKIVIDKITEFLNFINKKYIILDEENGFILNKILLPMQAEAFNISVNENLPFEIIDSIVKENFLPVGIFEFFDKVGLDVMYNSIKEYTINEKDIDFYKNTLNILENYISKGFLGEKNNHGFYNYSDNKKSNFNNIDNKLKERILLRLKNKLKESINFYLKKNIINEKDLLYCIKEYPGIDNFYETEF